MEFLSTIWFLLIAVLLIGYCLLDGFDLGAGFWMLFSRRTMDRKAILQSIKPFWDGNEVWLLTGGGAIFAAFPPVYATVFSGFYLALMLVLLGLITRAVAVEFRDHVESETWKKGWDMALAIGSVLPSLLFGVAVGNLLRGIQLNETGDYIGGFFALLNPYALLMGLLSLTMFALHGALYLAMKIEGELSSRVRNWAKLIWWPVLFILVALTIWTGLAGLNHNGFLPVLPAAAALAALGFARVLSGKSEDLRALMASGTAIMMVMLAIAATIFPNLVPARNDLSLSLTIYNSSSSQYTLGAMLVIALIGMPVVIGYTIYIQRIFRGKIKTPASE